MMEATMSGVQARRYANYGRAAGIVILACALGLWAAPLPGMKELPVKPAVPEPAQAAQQPAAPTTIAKIDADAVDAMSTRLDMAVVHADKPKTTVETKVETPVADPTVPEWTFLGAIHEADRSLAIISVESHQKILAEGRSFGDTKLVSVADDGIDVEVKGVPKHIDRGSRSGSSVAWLRNLQNSAPPTRVIAGQPGGQPNLPPEVAQRLRERGITPDQMANWRNNGRGGPGGGGPGGGGGGNNGNGRNRATQGGGGNGAGQRGDLRIQADMPLMKPEPARPVPVDVRSVN